MSEQAHPPLVGDGEKRRDALVNECFASLPPFGTPAFLALLRDDKGMGVLPSEVLVRWIRAAWLLGNRSVHDEVCALLFERIRYADQRWAARLIARTSALSGERAALAADLEADLCERLLRAWHDHTRQFWEVAFQKCLWRERQHAYTAFLAREGMLAVRKGRPDRLPSHLLLRLDRREPGDMGEIEDTRAARSLVAVEHQDTIEGLLAVLPANLRMVVYLLFFKEMGQKEVAAFLGVSARTVRNRRQLALRELRDFLSRGEGTP